MPSSTSIANYHEHRRSGKLGEQAQAILDFLAARKNSNFSRAELAEHLGLRLSSVCGRINELIKGGHVTERPKRSCLITGKTICPVRIKREQQINH